MFPSALETRAIILRIRAYVLVSIVILGLLWTALLCAASYTKGGFRSTVETAATIMLLVSQCFTALYIPLFALADSSEKAAESRWYSHAWFELVSMYFLSALQFSGALVYNLLSPKFNCNDDNADREGQCQLANAYISFASWVSVVLLITQTLYLTILCLRRRKLYAAVWRTPVCLVPWDLDELLNGSEVSDDRSSSSSGAFLKSKSLEEGLPTTLNTSRFSENSLQLTSSRSSDNSDQAKKSKSLSRTSTTTRLQGALPREILVRSPEPEMPTSRMEQSRTQIPQRSKTAPFPGRRAPPSPPIMTQNISRPILPMPSKSPHSPARASPLRHSFTNSSGMGSSRTSLNPNNMLQVPATRRSTYDGRSSISRYSSTPSSAGYNSSNPNSYSSGRGSSVRMFDENTGRAISGGREYWMARGWDPNTVPEPQRQSVRQWGSQLGRSSTTVTQGQRPPPSSWGWVA